MTLKLVTAILMTMAAVAWIASAMMLAGAGDTLLRWMIAITFSGLAIFYWRGYFRLKNSTSGTE